MYKFIYPSLFILLLFALNCSRKQLSTLTSITIESDPDALKDVKITSSSMFNLDPSIITEGRIDSTGSCFLEVSVDKPVFANIRIGDKTNPIYVQPGMKLNI